MVLPQVVVYLGPESGLALVEVLFRYFAHPVHAVVCCLHSSFGILLREIRWIFGHSSASLNRGPHSI
jgi:hypothetical protein